MPSQRLTPPTAKARVVLQPLKTLKPNKHTEARSPQTPEKENPEEAKQKETESRPVPELQVQASEIESKMLAFCLDPTKKVNKDQTATIMRYFKDMRGIVEELLLHNSYLTGRLEQSTGEDRSNGTAILNAVNRSIPVSKRLEVAVAKRADEQQQPSYAEKVKMTRHRVAPKAVKPPWNVVIIRPDKEDSEIKPSEDAREAVFTLVNPRKKGIQVTAVRQISGNGLVVETTNPEGLQAFTENERLKEAGLKASTPQRKNPRMIMYDVPRDISEKEIQSCMKKQNQERLSENDVADIKFCFRTDRKDRKETNCAESGHSTKACPNKDKHPSCVNCKKAGKKGHHAASNAECPMNRKALELKVAKTSYE
jgi:hypothetical protein